jgi:vacuolar-type H+-ATPase subunit E/Vma4
LNIEEKLAFFSKIAVQEAEQERSRILENIDGRMSELVKTVAEDAQKQADMRLRAESSKVEQTKNKEIIEASTDFKKAVIDVRCRLLDEMFESAACKARAYARTEEYRERLLSDIKELAARYDHAKVYLMECDFPISQALPGNCECAVVRDDFIGGFKLLITERNAVEDHTYLSRFKAARADFNELKISHTADNGKEAGK